MKKRLQFMVMVTVVDNGTDILLLVAWHVYTVFKSLLESFSSFRAFLTLPFDKRSLESSSRAFSFHQVTRGAGEPANYIYCRNINGKKLHFHKSGGKIQMGGRAGLISVRFYRTSLWIFLFAILFIFLTVKHQTR